MTLKSGMAHSHTRSQQVGGGNGEGDREFPSITKVTSASEIRIFDLLEGQD